MNYTIIENCLTIFILKPIKKKINYGKVSQIKGLSPDKGETASIGLRGERNLIHNFFFCKFIFFRKTVKYQKKIISRFLLIPKSFFSLAPEKAGGGGNNGPLFPHFRIFVSDLGITFRNLSKIFV